MKTGNVIRVQRHKKYAVISQEMLRDSRLSFAARGLLSYLLSKPDDWEMRTEDLITQSPAGRDAVYAILKELEKCGYLVRQRVKVEKGHMTWQTTVFETFELAQSLSAPNTEKPETASPITAFPDTDAPNTEKAITGRPYTEKPHGKEVSSNEVLNEEIPKEVNKTAQATPSHSGAKRPTARGQQKPHKRDERKRDPRTNHPAIRLVKQITGYYPRLILYDKIIAAMGEHPDFHKATECATEWAARGFRMDNHNWIFDWYVNGIPERNGSGQPNAKQHASGPRVATIREYDYGGFGPGAGEETRHGDRQVQALARVEPAAAGRPDGYGRRVAGNSRR